ncbi:MAG TPA: RnfABCDGE type electron transport complex subunit B [Dokdonella sp.]|nr:RnfABCDGE type electron transport complex subunit B [Dokdonella sp.]
MKTTRVEEINDLLPQTQCTRCGYPACLPYAQAIAAGEAAINQCPPGGQNGIEALALLLGLESLPLNPKFGREQPPTVALIDEETCIGCTKCIQACPVDAIVGAAKRMHTIITTECTGCELCIPPCPVDCISILATSPNPLPHAEVLDRAHPARRRYEARERRLDRERQERAARRTAARKPGSSVPPISKSAVLEAIARGKARRKAGTDGSSKA